jgi:hypothetical protein
MSDGQVAAFGFPRSLAALAWLLCAPWNPANADAPPADPCSLLPAAELKAVLGVKFDSPTKVSMPPAVAFGVTGTKCVYQAGGADPHTVILIVYVDGSGTEADANLTKLANLFHPIRTLTGFADAAYLDADHGVHARQGRVRYYINIMPVVAYNAQAEKKRTDLTAYVAAQVK